ncbi:MAG: rhomboid family intramembrane serine protease, partial [Pseudomonadales bacterium]|nr:rhomboid family intramembrane serine protease [Pseudomonadales bacterium]
FAADYFLHLQLVRFGIYPRETAALAGILCWPFLHGSLLHLLTNTPPLLMLGFLVAIRGTRFFLLSTLIILIAGGLGVWAFGRPAWHIGASGLIFGYFGLLVALGIYERRVTSLLVSLGVGFFYGGMILGVLPQNPYISWEGHLFGLLAGVLAARLLARRHAVRISRPDRR